MTLKIGLKHKVTNLRIKSMYASSIPILFLGHSWDEPKITLRQKIKNAYVEYRWGVYYFKFPWRLKGVRKNFYDFIL